MIANINIKKALRTFILTVCVLGASHYQGFTQNYTVYRFQAGGHDTDGNYYTASSIPTSLPPSPSKRLIYILSVNIGEYDNYSYSEYFTNQNPVEYFNYDSPVSENHYFALVDEDIDLLAVSFRTIFKVNSQSHIGDRGRVTPYANEVGKMHKLNDHNEGNGYTNKMSVGVSPPKPDKFSIEAKGSDGKWVSVSMVTEGEPIRFNMTANGFSKFNVERSLDGGRTWDNYKTGISSGSTYTDYITIPSGQSTFEVKYRARTYASSNAVVGQSYGYVDMQLKVVSKPSFSIKDEYILCDGQEMNSLVLNDISTSPSIHKLKVQLWDSKDKNVFTDDINKSTTTYTIEFTLTGGDYKVELINILSDINNQPFPLGQTSKDFMVSKRDNLNNLLKDNIKIQDCQPQSINNVYLLNDAKLPKNVTGTYKLDNGDDKTIPDDARINIPYLTDSLTVTLLYKTDLPCSSSKTYTNLFKYPKINYTVNIDSATCSNGTTKVSVEITNRIEEKEYLFDLNDGESTDVDGPINVTTDAKQTVNVYYADKSTCKFPKDLGKIHPSPITFNITPTPLSVCNSAQNGKIKIDGITNAYATVANPCTITLLSSDTTVKSYTLTSISSSTSVLFDGLSHGSYEVKLEDGNGCEVKRDAIIQGVANEFKITKVKRENPKCHYSSDGSLGIEINLPREFEVSVNNNNWYANTISNLGNGTYVVYARDKAYKQCNDYKADQKLETNALEIDATVSQPTCSQDIGTITLKGADTYYEYKNGINWEPYANNRNRQFDPGVYTFRGKTGTCYSQELEVPINQIPTLQITEISRKHPTCHEGFGSYQFEVSGGTESDYSIELDGNLLTNVASDYDEYYTYNNKDSTYTIHNLKGRAEDYYLEITNGTLCSASTSFEITDPPAIEIGYTIEEPIKCFGEKSKIKFTAGKGTPPYNFYLTEDIYQYVDVELDEWLSSGNHSFSATDSNGCESQTLEFEITQPPLLTFETVDSINPTCSNHNDGEIEIEAFGGVSPYFFNLLEQKSGNTITQTSPKFTTLSEGIWYTYVNDTNECTALSLDGKSIE